MEWTIDGSYLMKNDLAILNILAMNNWKRPVYFATTVGSDNYLNLEPYFQLEGLAYRIVPILSNSANEIVPGRVETTVMYDNVMNKFLWGNMNDEKVYLDENNLRMTTNFRINFSRLAEELLRENKRDSAIKVLDKCVEVMPDKTVPYNYFMTKIAELYYRAGNDFQRQDTLALNSAEQNGNAELIAKANAISDRIAEIYYDNLKYYVSLRGTKYFKYVEQDMSQSLYILQSLTNTLKQTNQKELSAKVEKQFMEMAEKSGI